MRVHPSVQPLDGGVALFEIDPVVCARVLEGPAKTDPKGPQTNPGGRAASPAQLGNSPESRARPRWGQKMRAKKKWT
eukprot:2510447-Pyramimonas_sp.AAC.1